MGMSQVMRGFKNIWGRDEEEDYAPEETEAHDTGEAETPATSSGGSYRTDKAGAHAPYAGYGGGSHHTARRLRPVATPLRARDKNIYTLKPTNLDEASIAADYLKTGSAVVLNLDAVDRLNAIRIIDFMSGVCYGIDGQGHAMKLGETIFLFTPADFEISSDETDYGENREFFFKELSTLPTSSNAGSVKASISAPAPLDEEDAASADDLANASNPPSYQGSYPTPERRSWER